MSYLFITNLDAAPVFSILVSPVTVNPSVVIVPVLLILPVPVMSLEFKSKSPPSCGVVSSTTLLIDTACALASV